MDCYKHIIDASGFRENVGIIVANDDNHLVWCKRYRQNAWQFPQGGIHQDETFEEALFRELKEETKIKSGNRLNILCSEKTHKKLKSVLNSNIYRI